MRIFSAIQPMWTTIYYSILLILVILFVGESISFSPHVVMCVSIVDLVCICSSLFSVKINYFSPKALAAVSMCSIPSVTRILQVVPEGFWLTRC